MLANNDLGRKCLVNRGGPVDELLGGFELINLKAVWLIMR